MNIYIKSISIENINSARHFDDDARFKHSNWLINRLKFKSWLFINLLSINTKSQHHLFVTTKIIKFNNAEEQSRKTFSHSNCWDANFQLKTGHKSQRSLNSIESQSQRTVLTSKQNAKYCHWCDAKKNNNLVNERSFNSKEKLRIKSRLVFNFDQSKQPRNASLYHLNEGLLIKILLYTG